MRRTVLVDCRVLDVPEFTGITAHVMGLVQALQGVRQDHDRIDVIGVTRVWKDESINVRRLSGGNWGTAVDTLVRELRLCNRQVLYHGPANCVVPQLSVPQVVTMHDLIPIQFRTQSIRNRRRYFRLARQYEMSLRTAAFVIFNSRVVQSQAQTRGYDLSGCVIHPAIFVSSVPTDIYPKKKYFVYSGGYDRRKNIPSLLAGFKRFLGDSNGSWRLVFTGHPNRFAVTVARMAHRAGLGSVVDFRGSVPRLEWERLVSEATALVNPSSIEGWGYPPVEALQLGTRAVTVAVPSVVELNLGPCCVMLEDGTPDAIAKGLWTAVASPQVDTARLRVLPTWGHVAEQVLQVYQSCF